ncbi:uncharacterized protein RJT20DRAFT_145784 [Scheffersomyces xylosifermentans]|uniref:uncharacterized protein n=1 Tax=Scheffersomyces xylosifermentans TaxID=1304137 RepID=UPI00315DD1D8
MKFGQKFQEFIYSISTSDKYSEFDSRKSFNRINKPDSETNLLYSHHNQSSNDLIQDVELDSNYNKNNLEGVHEVKLAWRHIKNWLTTYSPDLAHSLQDKCTNSDLNDFQKDLNIKLPNCLVEFFKLTDGQSDFGNNTNDINGLIFGLKLMPLDEIMISTENWRKVARVLNSELSQIKQTTRINELSKLPTSHNHQNQFKKKLSGNSFSRSSRSSSLSTEVSNVSNGNFHIPTQRCIPPGCTHETFAHPMWIPLITDEVGNYIGVDLSPPPNGTGKWGQVILFGREFDFKFKIADNFGDFLLIFANDLEIGNWEIKRDRKNNDGDLFIGNEGELVYVDKITKLETPYLEVLKRRATKHWLDELEKSEEELSPEVKQLVIELTTKDSSILDLTNRSMTSTDKFINNNISNIDDFNEAANDSETKTHSNTKSPLSKEVITSEDVLISDSIESQTEKKVFSDVEI